MSTISQKNRQSPPRIDRGDAPGEKNATLELAVKLGVCSKTRFPSSGSRSPPQDAVHLLNIACKDAKNIVQRGSSRKGRVLCVFADHIKPVKGGRLGTIHNLDSDPYLDLTFPEGVMRFKGSLVFPENKYLSLKVGNKEVVCEDVFESLLLFGEVEWLPEGDLARKRKIRNSAEDLPDSLRSRKLHSAGDDKKVKLSQRQRTQPVRNVVVLQDDTDEGNDE